MGKNGKVQLIRDGTRFKMAQSEKEKEKRSNRIKKYSKQGNSESRKMGKKSTLIVQVLPSPRGGKGGKSQH